MRTADWVRFKWGTDDLPEASYRIEEPYFLRRATRQDRANVWQVVQSCFTQESCWDSVSQALLPKLHHDFDEQFSHREIACTLITHGNRVIAASLVQTRGDLDNHLLTGPCTSNEYKRRGFGTLLLKESLRMSARAGVQEIFGVTLATSPAAKFVYPKFGGEMEEYDYQHYLESRTTRHH